VRTICNLRRDERGAVIVEFALLLPVFMLLILGVFTGAQAYNQKLTLVAAAREGARFGATLAVTPVNSACALGATGTNADMENWLRCVEKAVVQASTGELNDGTANRVICVAYVNPNGGSIPDDTTASATWGSGSADSFSPTTPCTNTSLPTDREVQIVVQRSGKIQGGFFSIPLTLKGSSINLFERA
jgi:Flp pilus assembly pilin Flp